MKNLIILISFLLLATAAKAQKIYFTDTTNVWTYFKDPYEGNSNTVRKYERDTFANGYTYRSFGTPWVREDTLAGIVYYTNDLDSADKILYNYNLIVGDTFISGPSFYSYSDTFILTGLDTIELDGLPYREQYFTQKGYSSPTQGVLEGIGCFEEGFWLMPVHPNLGYMLGCFENKGRRPVITTTGIPFSDSNVCALTSVKEKLKEKMKAQVVPNPANSNSILWLSQTLQHGKLLITNAMGQKIAAINIKEQSSIALGAYISTPGVYIYQLSDLQTGAVQSGRFVFE